MPIEIAGVVVVALILALVESLKQSGLLSPRYASLASAGLGVLVVAGYELATSFGQAHLFEAVLRGLAAGLSASGLYSAARALNRANTTLAANGTMPQQ
jgi:hypothetical protein